MQLSIEEFEALVRLMKMPRPAIAAIDREIAAQVGLVPTLPHAAVVVCVDLPCPSGKEPLDAPTMQLSVFGHGAAPAQVALMRKVLYAATRRLFAIFSPELLARGIAQSESVGAKE